MMRRQEKKVSSLGQLNTNQVKIWISSLARRICGRRVTIGPCATYSLVDQQVWYAVEDIPYLAMWKGYLLWIQQLAKRELRVVDIVSVKRLLLGSKYEMSRILVLPAVMIIFQKKGGGRKLTGKQLQGIPENYSEKSKDDFKLTTFCQTYYFLNTLKLNLGKMFYFQQLCYVTVFNIKMSGV